MGNFDDTELANLCRLCETNFVTMPKRGEAGNNTGVRGEGTSSSTRKRKASLLVQRNNDAIDHSQDITKFFPLLQRASNESAVEESNIEIDDIDIDCDDKKEGIDRSDIACACRSLFRDLFREEGDPIVVSDTEEEDDDVEKVDKKSRPFAHPNVFTPKTAIKFLSSNENGKVSSSNSKDAKYDAKHAFHDRLVCKAISSYLQLLLKGFSKMTASIDVAGHFFDKIQPMITKRDSYRAQCIRQWASDFLFDGRLPKYTQGKHTKTDTVISREPVQYMLRQHLREMEDFQRTPENFMRDLNARLLRGIQGAKESVCIETARNWMHLLGFHPTKLCKSYYTDDHNRKDVVQYRDETFLPEMAEYEKRMRRYEIQEDGTTLVVEPILQEGERCIILITHDESTFYSNECKQMVWMENG